MKLSRALGWMDSRPSWTDVELWRWVVAFAMVALASRADAQTWTGSLQWRNERIAISSECGPVKGGGLLRELDRGLARAQADVPGVTIPPLGEKGKPYTVALMVDPRCPGGALACSGSTILSARWGVVRARCKGGMKAVDHEAQHRWCLLVRPRVVPPRSLADLQRVSEFCGLADHPSGEGYRFDVAGRRVPKGKP